MYLSIYLRS